MSTIVRTIQACELEIGDVISPDGHTVSDLCPLNDGRIWVDIVREGDIVTLRTFPQADELFKTYREETQSASDRRAFENTFGDPMPYRA